MILSGIVEIIGGLFFASMSTMMRMNYLDALGGIASGVFVALGIASFVIAWGLFKGKSWAWTVTLIITIISLGFSLVAFDLIGLIIDGIILYYLFRPHVKAYFGKSEQIL